MTHQKNDKRMTKEREAEIRATHGCLIPREGVSMPSCHEYTSCDCTVFELLAELDTVRNAAGAIAIDNRFEIVDLRKERDEFLAELDAARSELDEQCRLNGMGGSREFKLMSQVLEKDKEIERLKAERDELVKLNSNGCDLLAKAYEERDQLRAVLKFLRCEIAESGDGSDF